MNTKTDDALVIGRINKSVELVCGDVRYDAPMLMSRETLDSVARERPDSYLSYLQSLCDATREQRYVSYEDGIVSLVCASVSGGTETVYRIDLLPSDGMLWVEGVTVLGLIALPSNAVDMRKALRRGY